MLRENIQEENFPELPEGSRAPTYDFVYKGGFKDRNQDIKTVNSLLKNCVFKKYIKRSFLFSKKKGRYIELCTWRKRERILKVPAFLCTIPNEGHRRKIL